MSTPNTPDEKLPKLLLGQLPPDEAEQLSATFADDSRVVPVAESLGDDTLLAAIKGNGTEADTSDPMSDRMVDRLKADMISMTRTSEGNDGFRVEDEMPAKLEYFKLERELGQGGMGTVYLAHDTRLNRAVAIKTLKSTLARKPAAKDRFLREARVAAALEHECVVPIYYVGEDDGIPFLAMPLLKGRALDDHLKANGGTLPVADVLRIAAQVAGGLAAAHAVGLIHRDVKPSNLWVDADGRRVRVLDFGLARYETDESNLTASGIIVGTPAYMAPEQARGRAVDARADLFSLGVVMYQMLTGNRPFTGPDTVAILSSLALDTPPAPRVVRPEVPSEVSDLVMRLMDKDPQNRPASADVVRAALDRMAVSPTDDRTELDFTPPNKAATTKPATKPAPAVSRKFPLVPLAVALGLLAVLAGGAVAVYQLTFNTKDGTLVVELDDEADVRFKNGKLEVYDDKGALKYTLSPSERNKALPPGKYTVKVVGADGVKLDTESFEIEKNGKRSVKVTATGPAEVAKTPDPVKPGKPAAAGGSGLHLFFYGLAAEAPAPALDVQKPWTVEAYFTPLTENVAKNTCQVVGCVAGMHLGVKDGKYVGYSFHGGTSAGVVKTGERVHVACVQTETKRMLFLNGKLMESVDNPLPEVKLDLGKLQFGLVNNVVGTPPIDVLVDGVRVSQAVRYTKDFTAPGRHVPDKETLALYHCDEGQGDKLTDSSGNNLHGKIINAKWGKAPAAAVPHAGGSLRFAEATDTSGVSVPTLSIPGQGPFTIEGYVTLKADQGFVEHRVLLGREYQFALSGQSDENAIFDLWSGGAGKYVHATSEKLPNPTKRFHVACVRTDTEHILYVDGKPVAKSMAMATGTTGFHIGLKVAADFSEIRVSGVARYDKEFVPAARFTPDKDTMALWHCDDGAGDTLTDSSGNGHHGKVVGGTWVKAIAFAPLDPAWLKGVAAMTPDVQVQAVYGELKKRNPDFNPKSEFNKHTSTGDTVVELELDGKLTDLTPVRALAGLKKLQVRHLVEMNSVNLPLKDLSPLTGLSLTHLVLAKAEVMDFTPLKGMPLQSLALHSMKVPDLSQFAGLPLEHLGLRETDVSDLTPIRGLKLKSLHLFGTRVADLRPVAGMPLEVLVTSNFVVDLTPLKGMRLSLLESYGPVTDLSTLKGMPLESLWILDSKVTNLSPLEGMALRHLQFDFNPERDGKILRSLKSLETLNGKPAKDVLK